MKKALILVLSFIVFTGSAFANPEKYYIYDSNLNVTFVPTEIVDKADKKEYKKVLKNEKYISKKKYSKAEELFPDSVANLARFITAYTDQKDYPKALQYAMRLKEVDKTNLFPVSAKDYRIGVLYSQNGDYVNSNNYLLPYINSNTLALFQVAQNYFFMQDLKTAEAYAKKISEYSSAYLPAQEMLYTIYDVTKQPQFAYKSAQNLIKYDPANPQNYIKLATATTNNSEKLRNYYMAKRLFYSQNLITTGIGLNAYIAPLEQAKIDNAYKKISVYCKKPDWLKIKSRNGDLLKNDVEYWDKRQTDFFESTNDCIKRYSGNNLVACFNDVNTTQLELDKELAAESARRIEAEQREVQIRLLQQQNALINEQNMLQWTRYGYYPRYGYYRRPYYW